MNFDFYGREMVRQENARRRQMAERHALIEEAMLALPREHNRHSRLRSLVQLRWLRPAQSAISVNATNGD
jgi:hypothetical protein